MLQTWVNEVPPEWVVKVFVGGCAESGEIIFPASELAPRAEVVCLETEDDEYPPQRKVFSIWDHLTRKQSENFEWFAKVDSDTYVNVAALDALLRTALPATLGNRSSTRPQYIGLAGWGRSEEGVDRLGLSGRPYCVGLGYLISRETLVRVGQAWLSECANSVVSNHSDTEVGRCVIEHAKVDCEDLPDRFHQVYWARVGAAIRPYTLLKATQQIKLKFPAEPFSAQFDAAFVHSIKDPGEYRRFHRQVVQNLRPPQTPLGPEHSSVVGVSSGDRQKKIYNSARWQLGRTCVNNPARQHDRFGTRHTECKPSAAAVEAASIAGSAGTAHTGRIPIIIRSSGHRPTDLARLLAQLDSLSLATAPIVVTPSDQIGEGLDSGLDMNVADALGAALYGKSNFSTDRLGDVEGRIAFSPILMILNESDVLRCSFASYVAKLMASPRCGGHFGTVGEGGVAFLGATVEPERHRGGWSSQDSRQCFNVGAVAGPGSGSMLIHRTAAAELAAFIRAHHAWAEASGTNANADAISVVAFADHLSDLGFIVRATIPNLIVSRNVSSAVLPLCCEVLARVPSCRRPIMHMYMRAFSPLLVTWRGE